MNEFHEMNIQILFIISLYAKLIVMQDCKCDVSKSIHWMHQKQTIPCCLVQSLFRSFTIIAFCSFFLQFTNTSVYLISITSLSNFMRLGLLHSIRKKETEAQQHKAIP